ncbi:MAG: hypothetical protein IT364_19835 [Candidatus Hydrogenedentes bacterium]|nr:hypothetical protein [Candidatus Hydrogenedentota bacterium]
MNETEACRFLVSAWERITFLKADLTGNLRAYPAWANKSICIESKETGTITFTRCGRTIQFIKKAATKMCVWRKEKLVSSIVINFEANYDGHQLEMTSELPQDTSTHVCDPIATLQRIPVPDGVLLQILKASGQLVCCGTAQYSGMSALHLRLEDIRYLCNPADWERAGKEVRTEDRFFDLESGVLLFEKGYDFEGNEAFDTRYEIRELSRSDNSSS